MPTTVRKAIEIKAPIARVWDFIGTDAGLRQWWQTDIVLEAREGGRCEERSALQHEVCVRRGVVTTYEPPRQLTLIFYNDGDEDRPEVMTISILLQEEGESTRVTIMHQLSGAVAIQARDETTPHGETTTTTSHVPEIVNRLHPMGSTLLHGMAPVHQPAIGGNVLDVTMWHGLHQRQWTQRLERLFQLASN